VQGGAGEFAPADSDGGASDPEREPDADEDVEAEAGRLARSLEQPARGGTPGMAGRGAAAASASARAGLADSADGAKNGVEGQAGGSGKKRKKKAGSKGKQAQAAGDALHSGVAVACGASWGGGAADAADGCADMLRMGPQIVDAPAARSAPAAEPNQAAGAPAAARPHASAAAPPGAAERGQARGALAAVARQRASVAAQDWLFARPASAASAAATAGTAGEADAGPAGAAGAAGGAQARGQRGAPPPSDPTSARPAGLPSFIQAAAFGGARAGLVFRTGEWGVGYYKDAQREPAAAGQAGGAAEPGAGADVGGAGAAAEDDGDEDAMQPVRGAFQPAFNLHQQRTRQSQELGFATCAEETCGSGSSITWPARACHAVRRHALAPGRAGPQA